MAYLTSEDEGYHEQSKGERSLANADQGTQENEEKIVL